ncbi:hypothetical protein K457DRAFT_566524 [Linnemannia elongata AG-77]|uniref:Uncharacterized protein n=1 Tax=Linnemannia elongata AG-77 TaxID=1314771 RepID=A0A197JSS3_9FUNG|nr:hypothetical protein K457DRAFT_566524 [Linnemannia elongata AG-77]
MFAPAPMALLQESDQTWGYLLCVHSLTLKNRAVIVSARTSLSIDHGLRNNTEELLELILSSFNHSLDVCFLQCSLSHSLTLSFSLSRFHLTHSPSSSWSWCLFFVFYFQPHAFCSKVAQRPMHVHLCLHKVSIESNRIVVSNTECYPNPTHAIVHFDCLYPSFFIFLLFCNQPSLPLPPTLTLPPPLSKSQFALTLLPLFFATADTKVQDLGPLHCSMHDRC